MSHFTIKASIHTLNNLDQPPEQIRFIPHFISHPNYTNKHFLNDLALIRVSLPFNLTTSYVSQIKISDLTILENMNLTVIGWNGSSETIPTATVASVLQQVIVQKNAQCTPNQFTNADTQLCASGTCSGNTGNPLMIYSNENQRYELIGITSFRNACLTEGLYTRVLPYLNYIMDIVENPPTLPTVASPATILSTTTTSEILGHPILFICNTSYSCGYSSTTVVFHDEFPFVSLRMPVYGHFCAGFTCLPLNNAVIDYAIRDTRLTAIGWGELASSGFRPTKL
ncbi:hypothetical protein I4U23_001363 [Adineta vaga]|nr:hypothetical protein I4U23_001363 [Adineta vaga]